MIEGEDEDSDHVNEDGEDDGDDDYTPNVHRQWTLFYVNSYMYLFWVLIWSHADTWMCCNPFHLKHHTIPFCCDHNNDNNNHDLSKQTPMMPPIRHSSWVALSDSQSNSSNLLEEGRCFTWQKRVLHHSNPYIFILIVKFSNNVHSTNAIWRMALPYSEQASLCSSI